MTLLYRYSLYTGMQHYQTLFYLVNTLIEEHIENERSLCTRSCVGLHLQPSSIHCLVNKSVFLYKLSHIPIHKKYGSIIKASDSFIHRLWINYRDRLSVIATRNIPMHEDIWSYLVNHIKKNRKWQFFLTRHHMDLNSQPPRLHCLVNMEN